MGGGGDRETPCNGVALVDHSQLFGLSKGEPKMVCLPLSERLDLIGSCPRQHNEISTEERAGGNLQCGHVFSNRLEHRSVTLEGKGMTREPHWDQILRDAGRRTSDTVQLSMASTEG